MPRKPAVQPTGNVTKCAWCHEFFVQPNVRGPKPIYCCAAHRQRAQEARDRQKLIQQRDEARTIADALIDCVGKTGATWNAANDAAVAAYKVRSWSCEQAPRHGQ